MRGVAQARTGRHARGPLSLFLAFYVALLAGPFLGSAHKVDDPLYLDAARRVLAEPFDPLGGASFWHERPALLFDDFYNPPLIAYLLAAPLAAGGASEISVHALMAVLALLALLTLSDLGRRLGLDPRLAWLVATSPALAPCALSAMTDVPFLLLSALAWLLAGRGRGLAAGLLAGLSATAKYVGICNLLLVALLLPRPRRRGLAWAGAGAAAVLGAFCAWSLFTYGTLHPVAAGRWLSFGLGRQGEFAVSFAAALGLAGLPAAVVLLRWDKLMGVLSLAGGTAGAAFVGARHGGAGAFVACLAFAGGTALLLAALRATPRCWKRLPFAPAAFWCFALQAGGLAYFGTARYLLPLLAPLAWLLAAGGELRLDAGRRRWGLALALGAGVSLAVVQADSGLANAWRELASRLPAPTATTRLWHTGRWGFDLYARARGSQRLSARAVLRSGDQVAEPAECHTVGPWPAQAARLARGLRLSVPGPTLRLTDRQAAAGFYSSAWGLLPIGVRPLAEETVWVSQVPDWLLRVLPARDAGPVSLDLGTPLARHVLLDGWSGDESFADTVPRTFVWSEGLESALYVELPAGASRLGLRASPDVAALGRLRIEVGASAWAELELEPGWRSYETPIHGRVDGGGALVVLRPAGHRWPGRFTSERRQLAVAVDWLGIDAREEGGSRGIWAAPFAVGVPGVLVSRSTLRWAEPTHRVRGQVRALSGDVELRQEGRLLWTGGAGTCAAGCSLDLQIGPGLVELRADEALLRLD